MLARKHSTARCPWCHHLLYFGLKKEVSGWKVQYACLAPGGCGRELSPGRVPRREVENLDEAYERAERIGRIHY
jgi:hypothetical protein